MNGNARALIVNADDFGRSAGINRGIIEAHERGIVTSASLMVCWQDAIPAAAYARSHSSLSVGLHLDLGEWICRNGAWETLYVWTDPDDARAVECEARLQLERFRDLLGCDPTHLDSHQHLHRHAPLRDVLGRIADEIGVPLRHFSPIVRYRGDFYGQSAVGEPLPDLIGTTHLAAILRRLSAGVTELGCHPGYGDDVESMYRTERRIEVGTLCAREIRDALVAEQIRLVSFSEVLGV
jgi:chitin disaccharide deacetylase